MTSNEAAAPHPGTPTEHGGINPDAPGATITGLPTGPAADEGLRVDGSALSRPAVTAVLVAVLLLVVGSSGAAALALSSDGPAAGPGGGIGPAPGGAAPTPWTPHPGGLTLPLPSASPLLGAGTATVSLTLAGVTSTADPCPGTVRLTGTISLDSPATVAYRWAHSDGRTTPVRTTTTEGGAPARVSASWTHDRTSFGGHSRLELVAPVSALSAPVSFSGGCRPKVSVRMPAAQNPDNQCSDGAPPGSGALTVRATITVDAGPQTVTYHWDDGLGEHVPQQVRLPAAGSTEVIYRWPGYPDAPVAPRGSVRLVVQAPNRVSGSTAYQFRCLGPSPGPTDGWTTGPPGGD